MPTHPIIDRFLNGLTLTKIDAAVEEYLVCADADDFEKYASDRGFFPPKNHLYSPDWVHRFWIRRLMAIAYFKDFDEVLDRKERVDGSNTKKFSDRVVRFGFHARHIEHNDVTNNWQQKASSREKLKRTRILELDENELEAMEGPQKVVTHKVRERDPKIIKLKKASVLRDTLKLACEVCKFDFKERYGKHGEGFAECHHIVPLSTPDRSPITSLSDLAIVCANCHRMLHRGRSWPTLDELRGLLHAKGQTASTMKRIPAKTAVIAFADKRPIRSSNSILSTVAI